MEKKGIMMTGTFTSGQVGVTDFLLETKKKKEKNIWSKSFQDIGIQTMWDNDPER